MMRKDGGFTLVELLIIIAIIGILATMAVPGFVQWLPGYRLRNASRDLYGNMQLAKMNAIRQNTDWAIVLDSSVTPGRYFICSDDGGDGWDLPTGMGGNDTLYKTVNLSQYPGIDFGPGTSGVADSISYTSDVATFNSRGTGKAGYVYLENDKNAVWRVGSYSSGVMLIHLWDGSAWQ